MLIRPNKNYVLAAERTPGTFRPSNQALLVPARASNPALSEADAFMPDQVVQSGNEVTDLGLGKRSGQINRALLRANFQHRVFKPFLDRDRFATNRAPNRIPDNGLAPMALPARRAERLGTPSERLQGPAPEQLSAPQAQTLNTPMTPAPVSGMGDFDPRTSFLEQGTTIRRGRTLYSTDHEGKPNAALQGWNVRLPSPTRTQITYSRITSVPPAAVRPPQPIAPAMDPLNRNRIRPVTGMQGLDALDKPSVLLAVGALAAVGILIYNRQPAR